MVRYFPSKDKPAAMQMQELKNKIELWSKELGFQQLGVADTDLAEAEKKLQQWLEEGKNGTMEWMAKHGNKRSRPDQLEPGTIRVISVRMDYLPEEKTDPRDLLEQPSQGYVARYALGRDYHKLMRQRLQKLADRIELEIEDFQYRVFCDSAPVMEKPLGEKAGLGWRGKHTNLINKDDGSWFFLGEIYTNLPLPLDSLAQDHCGSCQACIDVCPTKAITGPYQLDARRCISYLTIEHEGPIAKELRPLMGNRIYGCDDCQLFCPWNKFAKVTREADFQPRNGLDNPELVKLLGWTKKTFEEKLQGSPIRRIGYERWQRNIAIALGNAEPGDSTIINGLFRAQGATSRMVDEHIQWALNRLVG